MIFQLILVKTMAGTTQQIFGIIVTELENKDKPLPLYISNFYLCLNSQYSVAPCIKKRIWGGGNDTHWKNRMTLTISVTEMGL